MLTVAAVPELVIEPALVKLTPVWVLVATLPKMLTLPVAAMLLAMLTALVALPELAPAVRAPVVQLMVPAVLSRDTLVPDSAAVVEMAPPAVCNKRPAPLVIAVDAVKVLPDCKYKFPVIEAVVTAALVVIAPDVVLPILRVPAVIKFISALVMPRVSGLVLSTSAPPTLIKVPAVLF